MIKAFFQLSRVTVIKLVSVHTVTISDTVKSVNTYLRICYDVYRVFLSGKDGLI